MNTDRWPVIRTLAVGLFFASLVPAVLLGVGCAESGDAAVGGTGFCRTLRAWDSAAWWAAVFGPSALLLASQLIPLFRRHLLVPAICVVVAMSAFWGYILADATGNLG